MAAPVSRSDVWMDKKQSQCHGGLEASTEVDVGVVVECHGGLEAQCQAQAEAQAQAQAQAQCHGGLQALTGNLFNQMPHTDSSAPTSSS